MTKKYTIKDIDLKSEILMALPIIPVGFVGFAAFLCRGLSDFHHKNKLLPHAKSEAESPYASWYLNATINWMQFFVLIILALFLVYGYMK